MHHRHYNLEKQDPKIQQFAKEYKLPCPCFIGQGCSKSVGSDIYGFYVTSLSKTKSGKPIVGLTSAKTKFAKSWADGDEECSLDIEHAKPECYLTTFGHYAMTGNDKWWLAAKDGTRLTSKNYMKLGYNRHGIVQLSWNGCSSYRDPSF
jgi:hypothetical protein